MSHGHKPTPLKLIVQDVELENDINGRVILKINGRSLNGRGREYALVATINSFDTLRKVSTGLKNIIKEKLVEIEQELKSML